MVAQGQKGRPDIRRLTSTEEESPALQLREVCKAVQELSGVAISPSNFCVPTSEKA